MSLLTTNQLVFSVDNRLSVTYDKNEENWGLVIQSAQERDSASYLCQVSRGHGVREEEGMSDQGPGGHVAANWQAFSLMYLLEG